MEVISITNVSKDTTDTQYEICPTMNIISTINKDTLSNYRVNWEKIYELSTNPKYSITYKGDGKFFILVDDSLNLNIYETNKGQLITTIANKKDLELISWSECYNGDIIDNDSMFEYIENSMPLLSSISNSILENKEKFDFIIYGGEGQLNLSIFGIFNIENLIKLSGTFLAHINNNNNIIENYVLSQDSNDLVIYKLDIEFLKTYPNLNRLSLICSKISKYFSTLQDSITQIGKESKIYLEHSKKIIELLKDESSEYVDELYDVLLTGMISKGVHTWLTDYLSTIGLTRWQTLLMKCFQLVRSIVFTSVIPLIERLILNYTNFTTLIVNKSQDQIIAKLQSLLKFFYKFVNDVNAEFRNFNKFIDWLNLVLKNLNDDLSDEKKLDILKSLSNVDIDIISEFLNQNLNHSCIPEYMKPSSSILTLTRELQVFINAKFSILKMEIKKNMQLASSFKIPGVNIEYYEYQFTKHEDKLYIITLAGDTLTILSCDMITTQQITIRFDQGQQISKIKTSDKIVTVLLGDTICKIDITAGTTVQTIKTPLPLYNMACNDDITVLVDRTQLSVTRIF